MLTKKEIIKKIAKQKGFRKDDVELIVNSFVDEIIDGLLTKKNVKISSLGQFEIRKRAAKKARNIQTGEELLIAESNAPFFKASKTLKDLIN